MALAERSGVVEVAGESVEVESEEETLGFVSKSDLNRTIGGWWLVVDVMLWVLGANCGDGNRGVEVEVDDCA